MAYEDRIEIKSLVGETLIHIDTDEYFDEIMLTTASGRVIRIYHDQNCCESVRIEDTQGNWHDLLGKVIVEATHDEDSQGNPPPKFSDSWTRTTLTFRVNDATVISKWIGESSGCYSESVNLEEIKRR